MPADAGAGRQDVHAGMPIGEADHLPHIDAHRIGDEAQFVGERDIDVAERVFGELGHLGGASGGRHAGAANETAVEGQRLSRATGRDTADHAVIVDELDQDSTWKHTLGTISDGDVGDLGRPTGHLQIGPKLGEQVSDFLGGADGRRRFQNHGVAGFQNGGDRRRGLENIADIGLVIVSEGRRHRDHEHVGRLDLERRAQIAARNHA